MNRGYNGRGFTKVKSGQKYHAERHASQPAKRPDPADLGWTRLDSEQKWYIGEVQLVPATEAVGWIASQGEVMIGGVKRIFRIFVSDGLLGKVTNDLLQEDK